MIRGWLINPKTPLFFEIENIPCNVQRLFNFSRNRVSSVKTMSSNNDRILKSKNFRNLESQIKEI